MATHTDEKLIGHLNHLLVVCKNGRQGYQAAEKNVRSEHLKKLFYELSKEREQYIHGLKHEIRKAGGDPDKSGSTLAALHRTWMDVKNALSSENDKITLETCITGEKAALRIYNEVLETALLPADTRNLVFLQKTGIENALAQITALANL